MRKRPGSAFEATVFAIFALALIFFTQLLIFPVAAALNSEEGETGVAPAIEISSIQGRLDLKSPSTVAVVLFNNASDQGEIYETDLDPVTARSITAELVSDDGRIQVLSGPQMAGSLGPEENTTVEFMALAEGAEVGIYPARLRLNYSRQEGISTSGDDSAPYIIFSYEQLSKEIPLPAKVVLGPRIQIEEVKGAAVPGERSGLEVVLANNGDEPAYNLRLEAWTIPPFVQVGDELDEVNKTEKDNENLPAERESGVVASLKPGSATSIDLVVFTDANATLGYSPLPGSISYLTAPPGGEKDAILRGSERREDIALLVEVKEDSRLMTWLILPAGMIAILILAAGYFYYLRIISGRSGRKRRPKKTLLG